MRRIRWTRRGLAGLIGVALVASLMACDGSKDKPSPQSSPSAEERAVRASTAPDGGVVRVAESGFTANGGLTFGVVIENTSHTRAVSVAAEIQVVDAAGQPVKYKGMVTEYEEIMGLLPGERAAVGRVIALLGADTSQMVRLDVKLTPLTWWPVSKVRRISLSDARLDKDSAGTTWVSYTVNSEYPQVIEWPEVHAICRDPSHKIIGGIELTSYDVSWQPGRSEIRSVLAESWNNRDVSSCAEVYGWPHAGTPGLPIRGE